MVSQRVCSGLLFLAVAKIRVLAFPFFRLHGCDFGRQPALFLVRIFLELRFHCCDFSCQPALFLVCLTIIMKIAIFKRLCQTKVQVICPCLM